MFVQVIDVDKNINGPQSCDILDTTFADFVKTQIEQIETVQEKAIHIVLHFSRGMPYMVMLSAAEKKCQGNSSFTFLNLLLAYTTSSQTQEITQSFLGSGLTRNILECSLALNITAPLFNMC